MSQSSGDNVSLLLARLSLIPVLILGAGFSASQYVKQKNIIEDYAYKNVLAKSLVGFSEQFSGATEKGELHSHFIKSILTEIHNDPILKLKKKNTNSLDSENGMSEVVTLLKENLSKFAARE
jgi:hypothetical protein